MKLKNIGIRSFNCGGVWIPPGETFTVDDDSNWKYWVERGKATALKANIKEEYSKKKLEHLTDDLSD